MRKYTLVFSIAVHAAIVVVAFVVPIVATNVLPTPPQLMRVVLAQPALPPSPPPAVRPQRAQVPVVSPDAAPIVEPRALEPETPADLRRQFVVDDMAGLVPGVPRGLDAGLGSVPGDPPPPPPRQQAPQRVGGLIQPPTRIRDVRPVYPEIARSARVSGVVILEAVIAEDGAVREVRVLRSIPLLDKAAEDAVRQWRFTPTLLNSQAIPIVMTVTVTFALN
jgi:protein TonB